MLSKHGGQDTYVDTLCREINLRLKNKPNLPPIETLYIGGGTPSLLSASDYQRVFDTLRQYTRFAPNAEITLEANPLHLKDNPADYLSAGVNRLSIGVQSLNNDELKRLSRAHSAQQAVDFVKHMQQGGFNNISIDLMYGLPGQSLKSWRETLQQVIALDIQHVSMYGLKVENNTPLEHLQHFERYQIPEDDDTVAMYFKALSMLEEAGYQQYEFSNLALSHNFESPEGDSIADYRSKHNLNYWQNGEYYAFGASAHGYIDGTRYETVRDLERWLANPLAGEYRPCLPKEQLENALIFGLRLRGGVDITALEKQYAIDFKSRFGSILEKYQPLGLMEVDGHWLKLTKAAIPLSNSILADFIN